MELREEADGWVFDLPFLAPIPAGNEVVVLVLDNPSAGFLESGTAELVIDVPTRTIYADRAYMFALKATAPKAHPADDPRPSAAWRVKKTWRGISRGAVMSTRDGGDTNEASSLLWVARVDAPQGYR